MNEVVKNLVLLVWTFSAININTGNNDVNTLLLSEEKHSMPLQVVVTLDSKELHTQKHHLQEVSKISGKV